MLALTQKNGKDSINPELLKVDPEITVEMLYPLLEKIWKEEKVHEEWEEGLIIKILKKEDLANCNNWRGITLLSTPSKILTTVILNRIQDTVEQHLRKEKAGFCKHQSCFDLINTLRTILEQSVEWQAILYVSVSQLPRHGLVPGPGINYTGPREVLLEFVILAF